MKPSMTNPFLGSAPTLIAAATVAAANKDLQSTRGVLGTVQEDGRGTQSVSGDRDGNTQVRWFAISSGGAKGGSGNSLMSATVGQTESGWGSSESRRLYHGFRQDSRGGDCWMPLIRGNVGHVPKHVIDIPDLVYLVHYMFTRGLAHGCVPETTMDASHRRGNGEDLSGLNTIDMAHTVGHMFTGGPTPAPDP